MKKLFLLIGIMATIGLRAQDAKKALTAKDMVWYGLDFSKAHFVGQFDQGMGIGPAKGYDMKAKHIPSWNTLIATEQKKYDLRRAFHKDNVYYYLDAVTDVNNDIDQDACMSPNPAKVEKTELEGLVKKYSKGEQKDGVGLSFIVENFNKTDEMATVWVTFFDIASGKVLMAEKVSGKAGGVGLRNYWAGAIKVILNKIEDTEYAKWNK